MDVKNLKKVIILMFYNQTVKIYQHMGEEISSKLELHYKDFQ